MRPHSSQVHVMLLPSSEIEVIADVSCHMSNKIFRLYSRLYAVHERNCMKLLQHCLVGSTISLLKPSELSRTEDNT